MAPTAFEPFDASDLFGEEAAPAPARPVVRGPFRGAKRGDIVACGRTKYELKSIVDDTMVFGAKVGTKGRDWFLLRQVTDTEVEVRKAGGEVDTSLRNPVLQTCSVDSVLASRGFTPNAAGRGADWYAEQLVSALNEQPGAPRARAWSKPGVGTRVYVADMYFTVGNDGSVDDVSRGRATFVASHLYPSQRRAATAALGNYRAWLASQVADLWERGRCPSCRGSGCASCGGSGMRPRWEVE